LFLVFFYVKYWRFLFKLKADLLMLCIILCLVLPLIPVISFDETMIIKAYQELIKYYALYFIILVGLSLPLTPLTQARRTWLLYSVILTFLLTGWLSAPLQVSAPDMYTTSTRVKGYLVNGNVFALVAMVLLFLVDQDRTGKLVNGMNHAVILFLIYLSHTSGAILGYAVGMLYRFIYGNRRFLIVRGMAVAVGIILAAIIFVSIPPNTFKVVDDTTEKLNIAFDYIDRVRANNVIDFYGIIERKGRDVTSAVWRLYYWNNILKKFWDSSLDKILFGYGIGTMETVLGAKAHNDYLRFLFQTGLIGLVLNMTI
jgi:O-antigen ligase